MRRFSRHLVIFSLTWKWWHTLKVGTQIIPVCVWRNQRIRTHITKKKVCFYFCLSCFFPHHSNCHHTPDTLQKYLHLGFPSLIVCWQLLLPFFFFTCPFYRVGSVIWITIAIGGGNMSTVTFFGFHQNAILHCGIKKRNNFKYLVDFETCRVGCYFGVWSGGVWPFNRVRSTSFFSSIRYWPRDSFCVWLLFHCFPSQKIAVWMAIDWAGAGAGLAVSSLFFFARLTYFIDIHSSTCRRAIICPATIAQVASGERGE